MAAPQTTVPASANVRILVVEDEPAIAETLLYALRTEGLSPVWCATAEEAHGSASITENRR